MDTKKYKYDAFISHSVADKIPVADQLYLQLKQSGLRIWYSGSELTTGDSISKTIKEGLAQSRYGIVILSPSYLSKLWPLHEFYILWNREIEGQKVILPVLYDVTPEDLALKSLDMADRWSTRISKGLDAVTEDLVHAIGKDQKKELRGRILRRSFLVLAGVLLLGLLSLGYYFNTKNSIPPSSLISSTIANYKDVVTQNIQDNRILLSSHHHGVVATQVDIVKLFLQHSDASSYYRNSYSFDNGEQIIQFRKNVNEALQMDVGSLSPANNYSLKAPSIYLWYDSLIDGTREISYSYFSNDSITYEIESIVKGADRYVVATRFTPSIQHITVNLRFPENSKDIKVHEVKISGPGRVKSFVFVKKEDWVFVPESKI